MMTTRNIKNNIVLEEASNDWLDMREMMRNLQKWMDDMQSKYDEELKVLCVENVTMLQG